MDNPAALPANKWVNGFLFLLLFAGIVGYVLTDEFFFLVPAFALLFALFGLLYFRGAYWVLLAMVPLSIHVELLNNTYSLALPSEPVMLAFYLLSILIIVFRPGSIPPWFLKHKITIIILLQFLWLMVAVACSEAPVLSIKYMLSKSWYLMCFFIIPVWVIREKKDFRTAFWALLVPILLYMLIIMVRHGLYGFRFYYIDAAVGNLFYKHVDYASVISMFFPFAGVAFILARRAGKKRLSVWLFLLILLFIAAILLTYTRAAMGSVVFGLLVVAAIRLRKVNWIIPSFYVVCIALIIYFARDNRFLKYHPHFQETYMRHEFGDHLKATIAGKDMSSVERLYRWIAAFRMAAERPVTGFGPHSFYYLYKPYTLSAYRTYVSENYEHSTVHNYFLMMLVEQGLPAMILYALLVLVVFAYAQRIYYRSQDPFYKTLTLGIIMSFAIFFVNNLFSELLETDKVGPLVYLLLATLVILDQKSRLPGKST